MADVRTLVDDIYHTVKNGVDVQPELLDKFSSQLADVMKDRLDPSKKREAYLRISNLGQPCDRKLWYQLKHPSLGEELRPETLLKFLIGDMWEVILLFLAEASGHEVTGTQDTIDLHGVIGHRDAVIDGTIADVKSASSRSFVKFEEGLTSDKDSFGYLTQLDAYLDAGQSDGLVTNKDFAVFLAGDKTLGKLALDIQPRKGIDYEELVSAKREMLAKDTPPTRGFSDEEDGKSGNRKLGTNCSYCEFKFSCWPGLRQFNYAGKPRFLTKVVKEPRVSEKDVF